MLGLAPEHWVRGGEPAQGQDPVLIVARACAEHAPDRAVWISMMMHAPDEPMTLSTDFLVHQWDEIVGGLGVPAFLLGVQD